MRVNKRSGVLRSLNSEHHRCYYQKSGGGGNSQFLTKMQGLTAVAASSIEQGKKNPVKV